MRNIKNMNVKIVGLDSKKNIKNIRRDINE
jgi:hypothetical protein